MEAEVVHLSAMVVAAQSLTAVAKEAVSSSAVTEAAGQASVVTQAGGSSVDLMGGVVQRLVVEQVTR